MAGRVRGMLALLHESEAGVAEEAMKALQGLVADWWFLMTPELEGLIALSATSPVAALLVSKIYYHLAGKNYDSSLVYALRAGDVFLEDSSYKLYVDRVMVKGLDRYLEYRGGKSHFTSREETALERLAGKVLSASMGDGAMWSEALGFAFDARLTSVVEACVAAEPDLAARALALVSRLPPEDRAAWAATSDAISKRLAHTSPLAVLQSAERTEQPEALGLELRRLVLSPAPCDRLLAFQAAFDIHDNSPPSLILPLLRHLGSGTASAEEEGVRVLGSILRGYHTATFYQHFLVTHNDAVTADYYVPGSTSGLLNKWIVHKRPVEQAATMIAHGLINLGSGNTDMIIDNMRWAEQGVRWTELCNAATIGLLFKYGNWDKAMTALADILPPTSAAASANSANPTRPEGAGNPVFTWGGGMFALGLFHANYAHPPILVNTALCDFLLAKLDPAGPNNSVGIRVGACLGLGVAGMGSERRDVMEKIAAATFGGSESGDEEGMLGMAGALGSGLLMIGNGEVLDRLLQTHSETGNPTTRRALSIALALVQFRRGRLAEVSIRELCKSQDPESRRAGVLCEATAFVGTGNSDVIKRLLDHAASDVSAEVRRAAGLSLGFVLAGHPIEQSIPLLLPLLLSHCAHLRYGSALALGIIGAGSGDNSCLRLLKCMLEDSSSFVRAGVFLAAALVFCGSNEVLSPDWLPIRNKMVAISTASAPQDSLLVFGAIVGLGIANAGGRNVGIRLMASGGRLHDETILGLFLFSGHWDWFPYVLFISLSLRPLGLFILDQNLHLTQLSVACHGAVHNYARPSVAPKEAPKATTTVTSTFQPVLSSQRQAGTPSPATPIVPSALMPPVAAPSGAKLNDGDASRSFVIDNGGRVMASQLSSLEGGRRVGGLVLAKDLSEGGFVVGYPAAPDAKAPPLVPIKLNFDDTSHQHSHHIHPQTLTPANANPTMTFFANI